MANFNDLSQSVIDGMESKVKEYTQALINDGTAPLEIINSGLIAGMNVVGERFKIGDMFVPEVMMSAKSMNSGLAMVKPLINDGDMPSLGKVVIGTVKGDLHDIGKNLVGMILESAGFTIINVGVDATAEKFVAAVKEHKADIIGMSAMLTTTMLHMKETIALLEKEGIRNAVKVIIGGAPVTPEFAKEIGADGYSADASSATELCRNLISA